MTDPINIEELSRELEEEIRHNRAAAEDIRSLLDGSYTAADLQHMEFAPLREFVPGLITEGFGALVGGPKLGKSWMVLDIALGLASGGRVLGKLPVEQCDVLYLALEDGKRRIKDRTTQLLKGDDQWPANLVILNVVEPGKVLDTIREWFTKHPKSLVILDTLSKNRGASRRSGGNQYLEDYAFTGRIKDVVDVFPGSGLLAVHHDRKNKSDDFVDNQSGTNGLSGGMDYLLFLSRKRQSMDGALAVTGRDVDESEYALRVEGGSWTLTGDDLTAAAEAAAQAAAERRSKGKLGERSLKAVVFVSGREATTPKDLAEHLGVDNTIAGNLLGELEKRGYISKTGRGTYVSLPASESRESGENAGQEHLPGLEPSSESRESHESPGGGA